MGADTAAGRTEPPGPVLPPAHPPGCTGLPHPEKTV